MSEPAQRSGTRSPAPARPTPRRLGSRHADADDSPGLLLWQVTNRWQAAQRAALKPFGLTHVQFVLLASLTWLDDDGPVTQNQLAQHAATDPMMTSQVLRVLQQRGLIGRARHPHDARALVLSVTTAGDALANRAVVAVEECDADFFGPLGRDAARFAAQLRSLRQRSASRSSSTAPGVASSSGTTASAIR